MNESSEEKAYPELLRFCRQLSSDNGRAELMARQLWKRSIQLSSERSITQIEAMEYLLRLIISGQAGVIDPQFASNKGK